MPRTQVTSNSFTTGEIDPTLHERYDQPFHSAACSRLHNFLILPQGGVKRRPGYRHVAFAKNATATRLLPFVFSSTDGTIIEMGELYFRFFAESGQIVVDDVPLELLSPYRSVRLDDVHYTQAGDIMVLASGAEQQRELLRLGATEWAIRRFRAVPPPTFEFGFDPETVLTMSGTTGQEVTATTTIPVFLPSDVDRTISECMDVGLGYATITEVNSPTSVTLAVVDVFAAPVIAAGDWKMDGSPVAQLHIDKGLPIGARVLLTTQGIQEDGVQLVTNGTFTSGLGGWTDVSGDLISAGVTLAGSGDDETLVTVGGLFISNGVIPGHRALNITDGTEDSVVSVISNDILKTTAEGADWAADPATNEYEIRRTGGVTLIGEAVQLTGGLAGEGGIRQQITTVVDVTYRLTFDVGSQPLAAKVGTHAGGQDVVAAFSYPVQAENEVIFTAKSVATWIEFTNNQNTLALLDNVSVQTFDIAAWRTTDVRKYVRMNEGIIEITVYLSPTQVRGIIRKTLTDTLDALPGAWSLEESRWSAERGWPRSLAFWGSRLVFARTETNPARVWASRIGIYHDFGTGVADDDAVEFEASATEINPIEWLVGERTLLMATTREEFSIRGEIGRTFTPTDIDVDSPSRIGSTHVQPVRAQRAVLFVQRNARRIREITAEQATEENRRNSDLSIRAEHLTRVGIKRIAFQQDPDTILWVVTNDGRLLSMTYLQEHIVFGWAEHPMAMTVLDVAVIPHPDGDRDQVWLLTQLPGQALPSIGFLDDERGFYGQLMVDAGVSALFDPPTTTVSGLEHLEGQLVTVLTDGYMHPSVVVTGGMITLRAAAGRVEVGLPFIPRLTTLRPTYQGVPLSGLRLSTIRIHLSVLETINAVVNGERAIFTESTDALNTAPALFTGLKELDNVGWDSDALIDIVQDMPYPITVRGIFRTLEVQEP